MDWEMSDIEAFVIGGISFSFSLALLLFCTAGVFCFVNAISTQTDRGGELNKVRMFMVKHLSLNGFSTSNVFEDRSNQVIRKLSDCRHD